jgi:hypothetical protein
MQQALANFLLLVAQEANKGSPFRAGEYRGTWFLWLIVFVAAFALFWAIATGSRRHG